MKPYNENKLSFGKKAIIAVMLIFSLTFAPMLVPRAQAWVGLDAIIRTILDNMWKQIMAMITSLLKQVGTTIINKLASKLVGSGNNGPMFISDWQDYLVGIPQKAAQNYMNDYLSQFTRGMGSSSGYRPAPGFEGVGANAFNAGTGQYANYAMRVTELIKNDIVSPATPRMTYQGNPSQIYAKGNFKQDSLLRSGVNSPMAARVLAWSESEKQLEKQKNVAQSKAVAGQGFTGKEKNGMTVTPGTVVKDALSNVQNIGNSALAAAQHPLEVLAALATRLINEAITQGIGNISVQIQKQITGVQSRSQTTVKARVQTGGPGVLYNK